MAFDAFLKIEGIPGESTDDKHKEWIEILSYNFSVMQRPSGSASTSGGASSERATFSDFNIVKALDKASPKLFEACATGRHIPTITLELCRAGGDKLKYMEYKLSNVIISMNRPGGTSHADETLPLEEISFNYGKIELAYTHQNRADGSSGGQIAAGWNLESNKKV
ncbi:type VI secretion system needle tube protein TssD [Citrifermentans bemidjiense Bem]|uniref:Type VI secretion system needle tube protein TssD n=1 Tax=Citrifermentans bemidjiense (strain ATCC BAA-1014 / DSM 16622 / JCM 12645 / Bem) TaxID=404380 RepID=B5E874_CITBB|nr:type VI secretion system tube protein Hcp [Citrifermentans bemidjiense]ACH40043.1 type VI secretion system needle tube protein TssD [Citrifermentans bemidjiense Bem]